MSVSNVLLVHVIAIGVTLGFVARVLIRRNLFNWSTAGFWTWLPHALYLFAAPLYALFRQNLSEYTDSLSIAGGDWRGLWVLWISLVGIIVFSVFYVRTKPYTVSWSLAKQPSHHLPFPVLIVLIFFLAIGMYSLFLIRAGLISSDRELVIQGGRFVGEVTGYEYVAHNFAVVPILMLMLSGSRVRRVAGFLFAATYVLLSALDPWGRYTVVSMLIAVSLVLLNHRRNKWPHPLWMIITVFIALVLQARGHTRFDDATSLQTVINSIPDRSDELLLSGETGMLRTFYITSYINDTLVGFNYGIPALNYALLGFLPTSLFPDKYLLIEWLESMQGRLDDPVVVSRLFGAKSGLLGSYYGYVGFIGVFVLMAISGVLCRKLDGMVRSEAPLLVQATGTAIMSTMWMIWLSSDTWAINVLGILSIPAIFIWLVSSKQLNEPSRRQRLDQLSKH